MKREKRSLPYNSTNYPTKQYQSDSEEYIIINRNITIIPEVRMMDYNIGERVRLARTRKNMTQAALAEKVHCAASSISKIECGKSFPSHDKLRDLAIALDTSADYLLEIEPADGPLGTFTGLMDQLSTVQHTISKIYPYLDSFTRGRGNGEV
jgi:transcriptional regulator with XRE-family HTH domain